MKIIFTKKFEKKYRKLPEFLKKKVNEIIKIFKTNPFDPCLNNHSLAGKLVGKYAIKVTGDVRIVFEQVDDYVIVIFLKIGTHNEVYR